MTWYTRYRGKGAEECGAIFRLYFDEPFKVDRGFTFVYFEEIIMKRDQLTGKSNEFFLGSSQVRKGFNMEVKRSCDSAAAHREIEH